MTNLNSFRYESFDSDGTITLQKSHPELGTMSLWSHIQALEKAGFRLDISQYNQASENYLKAKGTLKLELESVLGYTLTQDQYLQIEDKKDIINALPEYIKSHYPVEGVIDYVNEGFNNGDMSFITTNNKIKNINKYIKHIGVTLPITSAYELGRNKPSPKAFLDRAFSDIQNFILERIRLGICEDQIIADVHNEIQKYERTHYGDSVPQDGGMVKNVNKFYRKLGLLSLITKNNQAKNLINKILDNRETFFPKLNFVNITNLREKSKIEYNQELDYSTITTPNFRTFVEFRKQLFNS